MNLRKAEDFIADLEEQFEWYTINAGWDVAERYLAAAEATCQLLGAKPFLGPSLRAKHPLLRGWHFFVVFRPFNKHVLFYEIENDEIFMRRAMHGSRDLTRRLLQPPGQ